MATNTICVLVGGRAIFTVRERDGESLTLYLHGWAGQILPLYVYGGW